MKINWPSALVGGACTLLAYTLILSTVIPPRQFAAGVSLMHPHYQIAPARAEHAPIAMFVQDQVNGDVFGLEAEKVADGTTKWKWRLVIEAPPELGDGRYTRPADDFDGKEDPR